MNGIDAETIEVLATMAGIEIVAVEREDAAARLAEMLAFHGQIPVDPGTFVNPDTHFDPSWPDADRVSR